MKRTSVPAELLADVKNHLNITWNDQATDDRIRSLIASATSYIDSKCGRVMDYCADGAARTIMMDYVRYARDEALDVFENNYRSLILALQHDVMTEGVILNVEST